MRMQPMIGLPAPTNAHGLRPNAAPALRQTKNIN